MQVQSATDPPKKLALGERAIMADGGEYVALQLKENGEPIEIVYPTEGTPLIVGPERDLQERAQPERRAPVAELHVLARGPAGHDRLRAACTRSTPLAKEKPGRTPLSQDQGHEGRRGGGREAETENLKKRYAQIFKV